MRFCFISSGLAVLGLTAIVNWMVRCVIFIVLHVACWSHFLRAESPVRPDVLACLFFSLTFLLVSISPPPHPDCVSDHLSGLKGELAVEQQEEAVRSSAREERRQERKNAAAQLRQQKREAARAALDEEGKIKYDTGVLLLACCISRGVLLGQGA